MPGPPGGPTYADWLESSTGAGRTCAHVERLGDRPGGADRAAPGPASGLRGHPPFRDREQYRLRRLRRSGGSRQDPDRVEFLREHFAAAHAAIAQGVDLRGYSVWSLLDNYEWADGYSQRFGIVFVDYGTQQRIPKSSAYWMRDVIAANGVDTD